MISSREKAKIFADIFGEYMCKLGYVRKNNILYQVNFDAQILKYVHLDVMAQGHAFRICFDALPFHFGVDPKQAQKDTFYELERLVHWRTGEASPYINDLFPTQQNMERALRDFKSYVSPLLESVFDLESCYHFHSDITQNCYGGKNGFIFVLMCVALNRFEEAYEYAMQDFAVEKDVFEANKKYYTSDELSKESALLEEEKKVVDQLAKGDAEYYKEIIKKNIQQSENLCRNFFRLKNLIK